MSLLLLLPIQHTTVFNPLSPASLAYEKSASSRKFCYRRPFLGARRHWVETIPSNPICPSSTGSRIPEGAARMPGGTPTMLVELETLVNWKKPAAYLGLEKSAFWNLVHGSDMPHFKINARVFRFRMSDVIRWAEGRKRGGVFIR